MIEDVIADHFSGNPQAGCRVTYPISRFFVHMDYFRVPVIQESHSRMPSMPAYTLRRAEKRRRLILLP